MPLPMRIFSRGFKDPDGGTYSMAWTRENSSHL